MEIKHIKESDKSYLIRNEDINLLENLVNKNSCSFIESQLHCYLNSLNYGCDHDIILIIDYLIECYLFYNNNYDADVSLKWIDSIFSQILTKIKTNQFSAINKWLVYHLMDKYGLKIDQKAKDLTNLEITLREYESGQEIIDIIDKSPLNEAELSKHLYNIISSAPLFAKIVISRLISIDLSYSSIKNQFHNDIYHLICKCIEHSFNNSKFDLMFNLLNILPDEHIHCNEIQSVIQRLSTHIRNPDCDINLDRLYSSLIARQSTKLVKNFIQYDCESLTMDSDDTIKIILDRGSREFNVKNCFLLATFNKKHFINELMCADLEYFDILPDKMKIIYLLDKIHNESNIDVSSKALSLLENMAFVPQFHNSENSFHAALIDNLKWIFKFINWTCKIRPQKSKSKVQLFNKLSHHGSPMSILNDLGVLNLLHGNDLQSNAIESLLCERQDQSELMLWYGFWAMKFSVLWIFNVENDYFANKIQDLLNKIFPLTFRAEILENLFSLLFLTQKGIYTEKSSCDEKEDKEEIQEESIASFDISDSYSNNHVSNDGIGVCDSSSFVFPTNLIVKYLSLLRGSIEDALSVLKRRTEIGQYEKESDSNLMVESSIISYDECKVTLKGLLQKVHRAEERFDLIQLAFKGEKIEEIFSKMTVRRKVPSTETLLNEENNGTSSTKATEQTSLVSCLLVSPNQLLRYCIIENRIDEAKQVYDVFKRSLKDSAEHYELLILEKVQEMTSNFQSVFNPPKKPASNRLNETAACGLKVTHLQSTIHGFVINVGLATNNQIDINNLLIDYSISSSYSFELSQVILDTALRVLEADRGSMKKDVDKRTLEFLSKLNLMIISFFEDGNHNNVAPSKILSTCYDDNLLSNPKSVINEIRRLNYLKQCIKDLRSLLSQDESSEDDNHKSSNSSISIHERKYDTKSLVNSSHLTRIYSKVVKLCGGKFNYLGSLFYHVRKVSEALNKCRNSSKSFSKAFLNAESVYHHSLSSAGTYFSVLYKSPTIILSMMLKDGTSPSDADNLAKEMRVDLLSTICSFSCPHIPIEQTDNSDFSLIDSVHPALCGLIKSYFMGYESLNDTVLIQNDYFGDDGLSKSKEKPILSNDLVSYFKEKNPILVSLLKLLSLTAEDCDLSDVFVFEDDSPLCRWIALVKDTLGYLPKDDLRQIVTLAFYPKIPLCHSFVMKAMERFAVNLDYLKIHKIFLLLNPQEINSSLETLKVALLVKLAKETNDIKYILQIQPSKTSCDLALDLIFKSEAYTDVSVAERALKSLISTFEKYYEDDEIESCIQKLGTALRKVLFFSKVAKLSELKSWKEAYDNLAMADVLKMLINKKEYLLEYNEILTNKKGVQSETYLLEQELIALAYCQRNDYDLLKQFLYSIEESYILVEKILPMLDNIECKEILVQHLLNNNFYEISKDKLLFYENYLLGLMLIKSIPPINRVHYEPLIAYPILIVEQMLMNLEHEALEKCITKEKLINCDSLIELYASKSLEINVSETESLNGSDTTMISSSMFPDNNSNGNFVMPINIPSRDQWVPDHKVAICMLCRTEKFSMFNRKHHCRRCGRVVCGTCSQKCVIIQEVCVNRSVRVCDDCDEQIRSLLSTKKESMANSSSKTIKWLLSPNEADNTVVRDDFYYESAPSASLCLSLLKLHSDKSQCAKVIIDTLCRPLFEILSCSKVDYGLMINLIKSLLLSAKMLINDNDAKLIIDIDFLLSRIDIIKMLVDGNCLQSDLITYVLSEENASLKLQEKLIEMERFDLAYHIATKYGLNLKQIWKTWAMVCLKHCQFMEARRKFDPVFQRKSPSSNNNINSKLLQEIFDVLYSLRSKVSLSVFSLSERCKAIKNGTFNDLIKPKDFYIDKSDILIEEGIYYLDNYGSKEDRIKFYVQFELYKNALNIFLCEDNPNNLMSLWVTGLILPCIYRGFFKNFLNILYNCDPKLTKSCKYLIYTCQYFSNNNMYYTLHALQVFMNDYIRAAMTQIELFFQPKLVDYDVLYGRLDHLILAKKHCRTFLNNKLKLNKGCLILSKEEVSKQIQTLDLQIEITKRFFEKKISTIDLFSSYSDDDDDNSNGSYKKKRAITLLESNITRKTQLAALIIVEGGSTILEGLTFSQHIIQDHGLDTVKVLCIASELLITSSKVNRFDLTVQLLSAIRAHTKIEDFPKISDEIILSAISKCKDTSMSEQLIKLLKNDVTKIDQYIIADKLKSAYLIAVKMRRKNDIKRIMDISKQKNQESITRICEMWLQKNE